jgi:hypothetical protein
MLKRLLRRPHPYENESLSGYIIRLTERNYYPSVNWILRLSGLKPRRLPTNVFNPNTDSFSQLSFLSDTDEDILWSMAFSSVTHHHTRDLNIVKVFDHFIPLYALNKSFQLCPICLQSQPYYRQVWHLSCVTACPLHLCLLIDRCPICHQQIFLSTPSIVKCKCQFDWRDAQPLPASIAQITLSTHLVNLCQPQIDFSGSFLSLPISNPVTQLSFNHLLCVLKSLAQVCQTPVIQQLLFTRAMSFPFSTTANDRYYDRVFSLLTNWPDDLLALFQAYELFLQQHSLNTHNSSFLALQMLDFFKHIFNCFTLNTCRPFSRLCEDYFWAFLERMSVTTVHICFSKHSRFSSSDASFTAGTRFLVEFIEKFDFPPLTLAHLLTHSNISLSTPTISFELLTWGDP